jgi:hypothetical protein
MGPDAIVFQGTGCLILWPDSGLSFIVAMQRSELMVCPGSRKSCRMTPFLSQKTAHSTLPADGCVLNFFFDGEFSCHPVDFRFDSGS